MATGRPLQRAQNKLKTLLEIRTAFKNYRIILDKAVLADRGLGNTAQILLRVIFESYVPKLQQDYEDTRIDLGELVSWWPSELQDLKTFRNRMNQPEQSPAGHIHPHESPLVLLLTLALETGEIPLRLCSQTDSHSNTGDNLNWGKLWSFPHYLEACKFQWLRDDNGVKYWPGLPHCVMTSLPIWTTDNTDGVIVSASVEKIIRANECRKETRNLRSGRFGNLQDKYGENVKGRINFVRDFSRELSEAFRRDFDSSTTSQSDEVRKKYFKSRSSGCHAGSLQSYHLQPQHKLPVYLPVVASVWTPDGEYKPACLLDRLRFCVSRPPEGEKRENEKITGEMNLLKCSSERIQSIPSATGCAEWDAFVTIIGQLDDRNGKGKQTELLLY